MLLYLLAVSGVMISAHYCGDNLESLSFNTHAEGCTDDQCKDETTQQDEGCCKDKTFTAKVTNDQIAASFFKLKLSHADYYLPTPIFSLVSEKSLPAKQNSVRQYQSNAPPGRWQNIPLYKLHQQLVIYG